jgi:hypothetical protein
MDWPPPAFDSPTERMSMNQQERTEKIAELRAEADRLEKVGSVMEKAVNGALFRSYGKVVLIPPRYPVSYAIALDGKSIGCQCYGWEEDPELEFLGHARDLLTIRTEPVEPTGAELVGKVCEFSHDGKAWTRSACIRYAPSEFDGHPYESRASGWYRYARLYREDRP